MSRLAQLARVRKRPTRELADASRRGLAALRLPPRRGASERGQLGCEGTAGRVAMLRERREAYGPERPPSYGVAVTGVEPVT